MKYLYWAFAVVMIGIGWALVWDGSNEVLSVAFFASALALLALAEIAEIKEGATK